MEAAKPNEPASVAELAGPDSDDGHRARRGSTSIGAPRKPALDAPGSYPTRPTLVLDDGEDDETLAMRARDGDREAFEELIQRYGGAVLAVLERREIDAHLALDLAQDVWLKVFRALPRYRPEGSFRSWLFSIALNHVRDAARRAERNRLSFLPEFVTPPSAPRSSDPSGRTEERAALAQALGHVVEPFRSAIVLVDVLDLSYEEAADSLSCAVGTVKSRVSRGRSAFRKAYHELAGPDAASEETTHEL